MFFGRTSIELHFFSILHNGMKIWLPVINNGEKIIECHLTPVDDLLDFSFCCCLKRLMKAVIALD